jgi:chemotaxis protein methyltransferase CheR
VWVAGCSAGEEVYSLAILLQEEGLLDRTLIYATDINPHALRAPNPACSTWRVSPLSPRTMPAPVGAARCPLLHRAYGRVVFDKGLREHMVFSDHSLATDSVFAEMHLVSCRNVLIYFDRELQNRALGLFRDALCHRGFLGLGSKESLRFSTHTEAFDDFVSQNRIYRKKAGL